MTSVKMAVHESFRLQVTAEKFFLEPLDTDSGELLVIDRVSQEITLQKNDLVLPPAEETKIIYGLVGIIRLIAGPYLVVITKRSKIGEINGQSIWKVTGTQMYSYKKTMTHMNENQKQDNLRYVSMVEHIMGVESYYFSPTYDLTHTMQRLHNTSPDFLHMPLHERADVRFVWNGHLQRELAQQQELAKYCMPLMLGFIIVKPCAINGKSFSYMMISRRSCFRAGTRYYRRGVDSEGQAANFVETEQIVETNEGRCSFVQTRGSVPLIWSQFPDLTYKPWPAIITTPETKEAFEAHCAAQSYTYGQTVIVNLLDNKGKEIHLIRNFANTVQSFAPGTVRYEPFDFHHECRKMRWDRLSILMDRIGEEQDKFGYFAAHDSTVICTQEGVYRTNCIDCLDRTNVVQSLLARKSLQHQLMRLGILQPNQRIEDQAGFEYIFKNVWADNADALAVQYAGTGALKTDFTRTGKRTIWGLICDGVNASYRYFVNNFYDGFRQPKSGYSSVRGDGGGRGCEIPLPSQSIRHLKLLALKRTGSRTKMGLLKDGWNSAVRYFMNNFYDGFRQDSIDLFLGNHIVEETEDITKPSPLRQDRDWKFYALPAIFIVAFSMCIISILIPDEHPSEQAMYVLFWGGASAASLASIYHYGNDFVDRPKLSMTKTKTE